MHKAYADGACRPNPGRGAYGYIIYNDYKIVKAGNGSAGYNTTNTVAEYIAIIMAMEAAINEGVENLDVYSDSQVAIRQLNGICLIFNRELRDLKLRVNFLEKMFKKIRYIFIPRYKNIVADAIAAQYYRATG